MKAHLVFNMDLPDDQDEHKLALKARDMSIALFEIRQQMLRPSYKHGFNDEILNEVNEKYPELFPKLIEMFNQICTECDVTEYT